MGEIFLSIKASFKACELQDHIFDVCQKFSKNPFDFEKASKFSNLLEQMIKLVKIFESEEK